MAVPFKSTVFTGGSFAASGSNGHASAGLLIYSASRSTSGLLPASDLASIGKDVFLFVSGVAGSRGTSTAGTLLVGGDLVISGTAYDASGNVIGSGGTSPVYFTSPTAGNIQTTGSVTVNGPIYASAGLQASGASGITGSLVIRDDIADTAQLTLSSSAGSITFDYYADGNLYVTNKKTAGEVWFSSTQPDTVGSQFLRVKPQNSGRNLVLFNDSLVGGSAANAENSSDTVFFVNGIAGSRGTATRGTAVFGGDLYVSGTMYASELKTSIISSSIIYESGSTLFGNSPDDTHIFTGSLYANSISGSITRLPSGLSYLVAGTNINIASASNGQVTIDALNGSSVNFLLSTTAGSVYTTGSFAFVAQESSVDSPQDKGVDNFFYVSGSIGKRGTAQGRNALFGGDVVVSGSQYVSGTSYIGQAGAYLRYTQGYGASVSILDISSPAYVNVTSYNGTTFYPGGTFGVLGAADIQLAAVGSAGFYFLNAADTDTTKYLLKITDPVDNFTPTIDFGNTNSGTSQFNFYGEIYAREVIRAETSIVAGDTVEARVITASYGLTGSLTRLSDGRSYLVAGSNVTISSQSNGQVTVSSTGAAASPGGSDTFVQFNDSGLFNGTGGLTFNKTSGTLQVTGSLIASSSGGMFVYDGVQPTVTVRASSDSSNQGVFYQEIGGDTYVSNQRNSGKFFSSVKTSAGVAVRYLRAIPNAVNYNTIVSFVQGLHDFFDPQTNTTDVNFYVGGKVGSKGTANQRGTALFAGDMVVSGSTHFQNGGSITGSFIIQGSIIPSADSTYTLGTDTQRWGHVYTGDLHLRNERGDWTILEEPDFLCVINNKTGKKYKMMLQPID